MNHKQLVMRCMTSIELFLKEIAWRIYIKFSWQCLSLNSLYDNQGLDCESVITKNKLLKALTSMDNDKTAGNDGISKQCYVIFSDFFKDLLCVLIQQSFVISESRGSQKQVTIKLMQKKYRDKSFIKIGDLSLF